MLPFEIEINHFWYFQWSNIKYFKGRHHNFLIWIKDSNSWYSVFWSIISLKFILHVKKSKSCKIAKFICRSHYFAEWYSMHTIYAYNWLEHDCTIFALRWNINTIFCWFKYHFIKFWNMSLDIFKRFNTV